jgi:hypothetical protein
LRRSLVGGSDILAIRMRPRDGLWGPPRWPEDAELASGKDDEPHAV